MGHAADPPVGNVGANPVRGAPGPELAARSSTGRDAGPGRCCSCLILLIRLAVRKQWIAVGLAVVLMTVQGRSSGSDGPAGLGPPRRDLGPAHLGPRATRLCWPRVFTFVYANLLLILPLTSDFSVWYAGRAWLGIAFLTGIALVRLLHHLACRASRLRRPSAGTDLVSRHTQERIRG